MVDFIKVMDGLRIPHTEIIEIEECSKSRCIIKTKGRKKFVVRKSACEMALRIERASAQIIPAEPGYSAIYATPPGTRTGTWLTLVLPVIAWRVRDLFNGGYQDSTPVVAGFYDKFPFRALMLPDGKIASWNGYARLISKEEWLESIRNEQDEHGYVLDDNEADDEENNDHNECTEEQES